MNDYQMLGRPMGPGDVTALCPECGMVSPLAGLMVFDLPEEERLHRALGLKFTCLEACCVPFLLVADPSSDLSVTVATRREAT
jgi:hypothetical protein